MTAPLEQLHELDRRWTEAEVDGDLRTRTLHFKEAATRVYGDTAVTIGRQIQAADYRDRPVDGEFRVTRSAVRNGPGWRLAGLHLRPIAGPPPGAGRPGR